MRESVKQQFCKAKSNINTSFGWLSLHIWCKINFRNLDIEASLKLVSYIQNEVKLQITIIVECFIPFFLNKNFKTIDQFLVIARFQ